MFVAFPLGPIDTSTRLIIESANVFAIDIRAPLKVIPIRVSKGFEMLQNEIPSTTSAGSDDTRELDEAMTDT
jgi:hypothetical protein